MEQVFQFFRKAPSIRRGFRNAEEYEQITGILTGLVDGSLTPDDLDEDLFTATKNTLLKAAEKGFNADFDTISYDFRDYSLVNKIRTNVYHFAGAKTYQQLRAYNDMLIGKDGKPVGLSEFKKNVNDYRKQALKIDQLYNQDWLETEYDTMMRSNEMARQWDDFVSNADLFPNLTYITVGDERTCPICGPLNGITLPINHAFWRRYLPPNHYRCRDRVEQNDIQVTEGKIPQPELQPMFDNNVGINGNPFYKHPFYERNDINFNHIIDLSGRFKLKDQIAMNRKIWNDYANDENFERLTFNEKTGGFHIADKKADILDAREQKAINLLVLKGKRIVRPEFNRADFSKNFDCYINDSAFELKQSLGSTTSIRDLLIKGSEQARNQYITVLTYSRNDTIEGIKEAFRKMGKNKINAVTLAINGDLYTVTYMDYLKGTMGDLLP